MNEQLILKQNQQIVRLLTEKRLKEYAPVSSRDELNALKEIMQEIALSALARANFFNRAAFQGGSCLRIVHTILSWKPLT